MRQLLTIALIAMSACSAAPPDSREAASAQTTASPPPPAQPDAPATAQGRPALDCAGRGLELQLTPSRSVIVLGEPAVVLIAFRNCSGEAREVPTDIEPEYSALQLTITSPNSSEPFLYDAPILREPRRQPTVIMEPGVERGTVAHVYLVRSRGWLLNTEGIYRFGARLMTDQQGIEAAPVDIRVRPAPSAVAHDDLIRLWSGLGRALYIGTADDAAKSAEWIEERPALSYLSPFVRVAQVMAESEQQYSRMTKTFEAPKCGELASHARDIVRQVPDPYFSVIAATRLSRCFASLDKAAAARELLQEVRTAHGPLARHPAIEMLLREGAPKE